jgi:hypothetical protein
MQLGMAELVDLVPIKVDVTIGQLWAGEPLEEHAV